MKVATGTGATDGLYDLCKASANSVDISRTGVYNRVVRSKRL